MPKLTRPIFKPIIFTLSVVICLISVQIGIHLKAATPALHRAYVADLDRQVYDGDTIKGIEIRISARPPNDNRQGEIWPGLILKDDGLYITFSLRISGIDTPEKRPSTKYRDGRPRSKASRDNEKQAALAARKALIDLLKTANNQFYIQSPAFGKYAGRMLGLAFVKVNGQLVNVSEYLIKHGHAKPYDGGTKPDWRF